MVYLIICSSYMTYNMHRVNGRVVEPNFSFEKKKKKVDSSYYKKYNGSCFMYLCEILSKLRMFKVTNFMTFSDGLLICVILLINHTHLIFFYFPLVIITI